MHVGVMQHECGFWDDQLTAMWQLAPHTVAKPLHVRQCHPRPVINRHNAHRRAVVVLAGVIAAPEGDALDGAVGVQVA